MKAEKIIETLGGNHKTGMCLCPSHNDRNPSLSVTDGDNVKPLVYCHAGCIQNDVIASLKEMGAWPENVKQLSEAEIRAQKEVSAKRKAERVKETKAKYATSAQKAVTIIENAKGGDSTQHQYWIKKIVNLGDRVKRGEWIKNVKDEISGEWSKKIWVDALLIPIYSSIKNTTSVQAINVDGTKDFLAGGRIKSCFYPLGKITGATGLVVIGEGAATVAAASEVMTCPGVVAFSAGNLGAVAREIKMLAPDAEIIIIADDDQKPGTESNPGKNAAMKAAEAVGCKWVIPDLGKKADAWDVWNEQGKDGIRAMMAKATTPSVAPIAVARIEKVKSNIDYNLDEAPEDIQQLRAALAMIPKDAPCERHDAETIIGWGLRHSESCIETAIGATLSAEWDELTGGNSSKIFIESDPNYDYGQPVTVASIYDLAKKNGWDGQAPWQEPLPLPDELLPVEPFVYDLLPDSLDPWVEDICERIQCPPDFVAVGVMVALGAVIGRKIGMGPQKYTDWIETPNLWGLIIGRPGILKSPALEAALAPLKRLVANALNSYENAFKEFAKESIICELRSEEGKKKARAAIKKESTADVSEHLMIDEAEEPILHRYMTNDSSPAALGELLRQNQNGVLVYRDELVSLIKGLDREENAEGRGFYLTGWNGNSPYTFDRIGRGMNLHIEAVCLNVLGGTQPGKIATYIGHAVKGGKSDDGLIQRFSLMVWPDNSKDWKNVDRWPDNDAKNAAFKVFDYLDKLNPLDIKAMQDTDIDGQPDGIPYLRFNDEALKLFNEWRHALEIRIRDDSLPPYLESHFSKYRKLIPALSLLIHLCEGGHGAVTEAPTLKALAWGEYLESHARRIYQAGANNEVGTAKAILKKIKDGSLKNGFKGWNVWRPNWSMLTDREKVNAGLTMLIDYGYLRAKTDYKTGGRNSTTYQIYPGYLP